MSGLAASGICVSFDGRRVLEDISLALETSKVTAILGPNGAGKSTLLACLAGLRRPDAGRVSIDGLALDGLSPRLRARRIGFLSQTPEIAWDLDVRALVGLGRIPHLGAMGLSAADEAAVDRALKDADVEAFASRRVSALSGGERARVLIARALAGEPDWLLADEPFAGLDPGHQLDIARLFENLARSGKGLLVTLHDLTLAARLADRSVLISEGRILADGAPLKALTPAALAAAYGVEARVAAGAGGPLIEVVGRRGP